MRILIRLNPEQDFAYQNDYHYHLQASVYSLIRETGRINLHDKTGYKFFCFSNIFPYHPKLLKGCEENLMISTPDSDLALELSKLLRETTGTRKLRMGKIELLVAGVEGPFGLEVRPGAVVKIKNSTPIIIRIPSDRYKAYEIQSERPYLFWRETIALEAFVKQLRDNMEKKLSEYGSSESHLGYHAERSAAQPLPEILSYRYLKTVSKPLTVKGETHPVIGSLWEFEFVPQNQREASNLEFVAECGFGERNSLGFGFMNRFDA